MSFLNVKRTTMDALCFGFVLIALYFGITRPERIDLERNISTPVYIGLFLIFVGAIASILLRQSKVETLGSRLFQGPTPPALEAAETWVKTFWGVQLIVTFVVMFIAGLIVTQVNLNDFFSQKGFEGALRIFGGIINPNFDIFAKGLLAIIETVFIAFIATVFAVPIAFLLAFFSAKNLMKGSPFKIFVYWFLRSLSNITRSIEPIIWAIIFSVWVSIGPFAGALSLMLHSIASLTKQYSEIIECVDDGPIEGIQSTGASGVQTVWFAVVPQIVLPYVSFTVYRWDINVRMATIIGLVGGGGIGRLLIQYQGIAMWREVGMLVVLITAVVWTMDAASSYIREAIK